MRNVAIVEDHPDEADCLVRFLDNYADRHDEHFSVCRYGEADSFMEANQAFDLVFMDIDMPGMTGLEAARAFREKDLDAPLVFVTNLAQYALHGYEVNAFGFLVKPVAYDGFERTMDKVVRVMNYRDMKVLHVPTRQGMHALRIASLVYVDVLNHDLTYHSTDFPEGVTVRGSLKEVEANLTDAPFVRVSSSCLVNMDHIVSVHGNEVRLSSGDSAFFSRPKKKGALERITHYLAGDE